MKFMNDYDIHFAIQQTRGLQNVAARFLQAFAEEVNAHSDGWAYWRAPVQSARLLMLLVESRQDVTESQLRTAIGQIRAFYTRRGYVAGMAFPQVEGIEVNR